jgi:YD repeat-containing protein
MTMLTVRSASQFSSQTKWDGFSQLAAHEDAAQPAISA